MSDQIIDQNVKNVREQIAIKKGFMPYYATSAQAEEVLTDYDTFPYPRWWRGVPRSYLPVVAEREAGWRPRFESCYRVNEPPSLMPPPYPEHCFQGSCTLQLPCYPNSINRYLEREDLNIRLNDSCIVQYR